MTFKGLFTFCIFLLYFKQVNYAQCNATGGLNQGAITLSTAWQTISITAGEYYTFTGNPCNTYVFTFCQNGGFSSFDTQLTITDVSGNPIPGIFNDDACGVQSELYFTPFNLSTYRIYYTLNNCITSGGTSTLAFSYSSFNVTNTNYTLILDATSNAPYNCVLLTPDQQVQVGCAWDANSTLNFGSNFSYDFTVNLGASDGGADGICFVMHNDPRGRCAYGIYGGDMGATGIINSVIVELDTYMNDGDRDDGLPGVTCTNWYDQDHMDIWINGVVNPPGANCTSSPGARIIPAAVPLLDGVLNYNVENSLDHLFRITWNAGTQTLSVSLFNASGTTLYGTFSYVFNPLVVFGVNSTYFGFTAATGFNSNDQYFCNPAILLPIELLSFYGKTLNDRNILCWQTASEKNNDFFILQRSNNGKDFETIGKIKGAGNSSQEENYSFIDSNPFSGKNFYRLLQTDFDGAVTYSKILMLFNTTGNYSDLKIFPNPAANSINISIPGDAATFEIEIFDAIGNMVVTSKNNLQIDISMLSNGIYFLKLKTTSTFYTAYFNKKQ